MGLKTEMERLGRFTIPAMRDRFPVLLLFLF